MSIVNDDDNLTTDAIPSAPRDDPENKNKNRVHIPKVNTTRKAKTYTKSKKIPNTGTWLYLLQFYVIYKIISAFANVINITNSNTVHIGPNVIIHQKLSEPSNTTSQFVVTKEILDVFENKQPVNRNDLSFVAQHIDDKWKYVGKALGNSDGVLHAFEHDYKQDGLREVR